MANWKEAKVIKRISWNERLISLTLDLDVKSWKSGQFIKVGLPDGDLENGERVERPYSLVNAAGSQGAEILFNRVDGGELTPALSNVKEGDSVWATADAHGFLILDEIPEVPNLWMLATGTGVGPFVAMLRDDALDRFERAILVHGVRDTSELAYRDELQSIANNNEHFDYLPVLSREVIEGTTGGRITQRIADGALETAVGLKISAEETHIMLCGNIDMIRDVQSLLAERDMKRHRRFEAGHISMEKYH